MYRLATNVSEESGGIEMATELHQSFGGDALIGKKASTPFMDAACRVTVRMEHSSVGHSLLILGSERSR